MEYKMNTTTAKQENIIEKDKTYSFKEAITLIKNGQKAKFRETIDVSIHLSINPKKKNISIKGHSFLPHNIEKRYNIAVFASKNDNFDNNLTDITLINEEDIKDLTKKNLNFNLVIATPNSIVKMGKLNKILNAKKMMPDMKYGTITKNIPETIEKINKSYIKFKNEKNNIINCTIGKLDLETDKLKENIEMLINDIKKHKPKTCKNLSIKKINISRTMGPGLKINIKSLTI